MMLAIPLLALAFSQQPGPGPAPNPDPAPSPDPEPEPPEWPTPTHGRVTVLCIKPEHRDDLIAYANSGVINERLASPEFKGLLGVAAGIMEGDDKMFTAALFDNLQSIYDTAEAQQELFGPMLEYFDLEACAPTPYIGEVVWLNPGRSEVVNPSYFRFTQAPVKPSEESLTTLREFAGGLDSRMDNPVFDAVIGAFAMIVDAGDDPGATPFMFSIANYVSMESIEAASAALGEIIGEVQDHFAGPPEQYAGEIVWRAEGPA